MRLIKSAQIEDRGFGHWVILSNCKSSFEVTRCSLECLEVLFSVRIVCIVKFLELLISSSKE